MTARTARRAIIALVALQAIVLCVLPLLAGARMPEGATVKLAATAATSPNAKGSQTPTNEIWLDYGFDELDVPASIGPGEMAYLELLDTEGDEPSSYGDVVANPDQLAEGATWIKLPVTGPGKREGELEAGPIQVWYDADLDRVDALREDIDQSDGAALVTVTLDTDGDPEIKRVVAG